MAGLVILRFYQFYSKQQFLATFKRPERLHYPLPIGVAVRPCRPRSIGLLAIPRRNAQCAGSEARYDGKHPRYTAMAYPDAVLQKRDAADEKRLFYRLCVG